MKVKKKVKDFIKGAIKRPGALTKEVGVKPSDKSSKVKKLAKDGTPLQKKQANFFLNVLKPASKKMKSKRSLLKK